MNIFRSILVAIPFMTVGIALSAAEVSIAGWPFWVILISLAVAALLDYGRCTK